MIVFDKNMQLRDYLNQLLAHKKSINPKFSMRAFAKSLEMNSGVLSNILNGKRKMTPKLIKNIGLKLELDLDQINVLIQNQEILNNTKEVIEQTYTKLEKDAFKVVSHWYHFAILHLIETKGFYHSPLWIAKRLMLSVKEVNQALNRLERLELITISEDKKIKLKNEETNTFSFLAQEESVQAIRNIQKQILLQSIKALEEIDISHRLHSSMTLSFSRGDIDRAKTMIKNFRRRFLKTFEESKNKQDVYQLQVSFFPSTTLD